MREPESDTLFEGRLFSVVRRFQRTDGGGRRPRDIIRHPGAAVILPILDDERICLIENYRIAVDETLIELPAGTLEPGEDPLQTARRELAEETGYRARSIRQLAVFYSSPGILDERMHLYAANGLEPGATALEPGEKIRPILKTWPETLDMIRQGLIKDAKTLVGLLYYGSFEKNCNI